MYIMAEKKQIIKSFSLSDEENAFVEENKLSPTAIIRTKVQELMEFRRVSPEYVQELQRKLNNWIKIGNDQREFIERKGILDEFLKEMGV